MASFTAPIFPLTIPEFVQVKIGTGVVVDVKVADLDEATAEALIAEFAERFMAAVMA